MPSSLDLHDEDFSESTSSDDNYEIISRSSGYTDDEHDDDEESVVESMQQSGVMTPAESDDVPELLEARPMQEMEGAMTMMEKGEEDDAEQQIESIPTIVPSLANSSSGAEVKDESNEEKEDEEEEDDGVIRFREDKVDQGIVLGEAHIKNRSHPLLGSQTVTLKMQMERNKLYLHQFFPFRLLYLGPKKHLDDVVQKLGQALALSNIEGGDSSRAIAEGHRRYDVFNVSTNELSRNPQVELVQSSNVKLEVLEVNKCEQIRTMRVNKNRQGYVDIWERKPGSNLKSIPAEHPNEDHFNITSCWTPDLAIVVHEAKHTFGKNFMSLMTGGAGIPTIELYADKKHIEDRVAFLDSRVTDALHVSIKPQVSSADDLPANSDKSCADSKFTSGTDVETFLNIDASQLNRHIRYLGFQQAGCYKKPPTAEDFLRDIKGKITTLVDTTYAHVQSKYQMAADRVGRWRSSTSDYIATARQDPRRMNVMMMRIAVLIISMFMLIYPMVYLKYKQAHVEQSLSSNTSSTPFDMASFVQALPEVTTSATTAAKAVQPTAMANTFEDTANTIDKYVTDVFAALRKNNMALIEHPLVPKFRKHKGKGGKSELRRKLHESQSTETKEDSISKMMRLSQDLLSCNTEEDCEKAVSGLPRCGKDYKPSLLTPCRFNVKQDKSRFSVNTSYANKLSWVAERLAFTDPSSREDKHGKLYSPPQDSSGSKPEVPSERVDPPSEGTGKRLNRFKSVVDQARGSARSAAENLYTQAAAKLSALKADTRAATAEKQKSADEAVKKASSQAKVLSSRAQIVASEMQAQTLQQLNVFMQDLKNVFNKPETEQFTYAKEFDEMAKREALLGVASPARFAVSLQELNMLIQDLKNALRKPKPVITVSNDATWHEALRNQA